MRNIYFSEQFQEQTKIAEREFNEKLIIIHFHIHYNTLKNFNEFSFAHHWIFHEGEQKERQLIGFSIDNTCTKERNHNKRIVEMSIILMTSIFIYSKIHTLIHT